MTVDWKRAIVGCVAVAVFTSCSGGEQGAAPTSPNTTMPAVSTTLRPVDTNFTGENNAQFCALAKTYAERSSGVGSAGTPAQLRSSVQEARMAIGELAGKAPAEIRSDVQVLSNAFGVLFIELDKVSFDPTRVSLTAFAPLQAPEFQQSTTRFQSYLRIVCGLG
jgi:hypothetical protein